MKLKNKLFFILPLTLIIGGCNIKLYSPSSDVTEEESTSYSGVINVINASNYSGTINYAPNVQEKLSKEEVYALGVQSTVYVIASDSQKTHLGSGVFFSEDADGEYAYLFTNAHVVRGAATVEIVYSNYKRDSVEVVGYNVLEDVAVLKVKKNSNYIIPTLKESDRLAVGTEVVTIGTPVRLDYSFLATSGILGKINSPMTSSLDTSYNLLLLQIDASLNSGNSGGPLFDIYGNLIGLNTMKLLYDDSLSTVYDFNFAIPIDRAVFVANRIFTNNPYIRSLLGITITDLVDISTTKRQANNITLDYGLFVQNVTSGGSSDGLINVNDIIVKIDDYAFTNKLEFQKQLYKHSKGETVKITVYRNSAYVDVNVTLQ